MGFKIDRIASSFVKEISYILATEIRDDDIKFVTVTDCKVTNDIIFFEVYFIVFVE